MDSTDKKKSKRKKKKERTKYVTLSIDGVFVKVCSGTTKNPLLARKLTVNLQLNCRF